MNNPKSRQQWVYDLLISEPTLSYGDCFTKYSLNFTKTKRTFAKDWKQAQARLKEYQKTINEEKLSECIEQEKKAVKRKILDKLGLMEFLSSVITDEGEKTNERIKAVGELCKMRGYYEPEKVEQTETQKIIFDLIDDED